MPPPPEQQAPLASSAFRLDGPIYPAPPPSIEMRRYVPPFHQVYFPVQEGVWSNERLVNMLLFFLMLDGISLRRTVFQW
jgi:hypothetical protein